MQKLHHLVNSAELLDIWLKKSNCLCKEFPPNINPEEVDLSTNYELNFNFDKDDNVLMCFITSLVFGKIDDEETFHLINQFAIIYKIKRTKTSFSDKTLREFLNTTVLFNAYPYHREQIHGQSIKMGLPPIIIPLFKPNPALPTKQT